MPVDIDAIVDQPQTSTVSAEMPSFSLIKTDKDIKYEFDLKIISNNSMTENFPKKKIIEFIISILDNSTDYNKFWEDMLYSENRPDIFINNELETEKDLTLIISSVELSDESSKEQFRTDMLEWLEKFRIFALDCIWKNYKENKLSIPLLSEILELIGIANLNNLDSVRIDILKNIFVAGNLRIRYGAIAGISNLNTQFAIPALKEIVLQEDNSRLLKKIIYSYVEQLKTL